LSRSRAGEEDEGEKGAAVHFGGSLWQHRTSRG
jgi:hypothetical protein